MNHSRRTFLLQSILATAGVSSGLSSLAGDVGVSPSNNPVLKAGDQNAFKISIFSKNLHWLDYRAMADVVAELGFDGVDLTVRPDGHVSPEKVVEDLPRAVEALKKRGVNVYMITTAINKADDPFTEPILKTAGSLGIPYYRMGWITYNEKVSLEENLKELQGRLSKLAALNTKYNIHGGYQNHSGANFGSPVWDLWMILKDLDPRWIGSQYDLLHATVEGANSWPLGFKLLRSHVKTIDIKDFRWAKTNGKWSPEKTPLGEGMVDFKKFFSLVKEYNIAVPLSIHYEYPLGGAENGAKVLAMKKEEVLAAMKKDLQTLRKMLGEAGLK